MKYSIWSCFPLAVCLFCCDRLAAAESIPAFTQQVQGDWYVLAAHQHNKNIATGMRVGSRVAVAADGVTWHDPEKPDSPLVSARCVRATATPEWNKQADPNELTSIVTGSLCPEQGKKLAARWRVTDNDVLLLLVQVAEFKGKRNGTYSGASPADVILVCQRQPVPAALKPDPAADARRLVGTWAVLGELDDANSARTRPQGNVEFTAREFFKRASYNPNARPTMDGTWTLPPPLEDRGRIDLIFRSGIEGNQGRSPALYTFHGEDILMVVYPEGGWPKDAVEKQEMRQPPAHFGSDGNRNMWILRRRSDRGKKSIDEPTGRARPASPFAPLLSAWAAETLPGTDTLAVEEDGIVRTELPLRTPRSRDPVLGGSRDKVAFSVWIPEGVKVVRGAVCNPFARGDSVSEHWKAACRHWQFAYVQTDFDAVKKEEFVLLKAALAELAKKTSHPEVEHMPLCFLGMSRGGGMSVQLADLMPERTIASVPVCLEVGPASEATRQIPVLTVFGERDGSQMERLLTKLPLERGQGARWGIAVQWGRRHEFGQANNLSFVFLDEVIARRLPKEPAVTRPAPLADIPLEKGWVGDPSTWGRDGGRATIQPWKDFRGQRERVCWFPSQRVAAAWQAFVSGSRDVTINEPAGLGDGQKFVLHSAARPVTVKLTLGGKLKPGKVELWDAHQRLAGRTEAPWEFHVPLRPGVHALFATVEESGQPVRTSRVHTVVVTE